MTNKDKAIDIISKMCGNNYTEKNINRMINPAIIAIENEYKSLRELLFNLKSCGVNIPKKVYLKRIQDLIDDEEEIKKEIHNL